MRFQLRAGRTGRPQHALHAQAGRQKIAKDSGTGGVARKVGEEVRRLPVCDSRQDQRLHIFQQRLERFALRWRLSRQRRSNLSRLRLREHRERLDAGVVVGDPIHHGVAVAAELVGRHVERLLVRHCPPGDSTDVNLQCYSCPRRPKYIRVLYSNAVRPSTTFASKTRRNSRSIGAC